MVIQLPNRAELAHNVKEIALHVGDFKDSAWVPFTAAAINTYPDRVVVGQGNYEICKEYTLRSFAELDRRTFEFQTAPEYTEVLFKALICFLNLKSIRLEHCRLGKRITRVSDLLYYLEYGRLIFSDELSGEYDDLSVCGIYKRCLFCELDPRIL